METVRSLHARRLCPIRVAKTSRVLRIVIPNHLARLALPSKSSPEARAGSTSDGLAAAAGVPATHDQPPNNPETAKQGGPAMTAAMNSTPLRQE